MSLKINYRDTIKKADRLETLAGDISRICSSSLSDLSGATNGAWTGDGGDRFRKRLNKCIKSLANNSKVLKSTSSGLKAQAKRYEYIERTAANLFKF